MLPTDLLKYREIFQRYCDFKYFKVETLIKISHFMSLEPVTGLNIINNILRCFKLQISPSAPGINYFCTLVLARQLNMYFYKLRNEDLLLSFDALNKMSEEEIDKLCFMRGIEINKQNLKKKKEDLKLWLSISNLRNVPHSLLLYTRINDFTNDLFEISDDEDEQEVLRRSPSNTYYLEKMRVFEETFGINQLLIEVDKIQKQITVSNRVVFITFYLELGLPT